MPRLASVLASVPVLAALALSTMACNRVHVDDARGPDGSNEWKSISCRHMDKRCFRTAAELCPNGYYLARAAGRLPASAGSPGPAGASQAPSPQASNVTTLPPQERWGSGMYSRQGGTILVQCAEPRATASR
jgi:hypothetical protein